MQFDNLDIVKNMFYTHLNLNLQNVRNKIKNYEMKYGISLEKLKQKINKNKSFVKICQTKDLIEWEGYKELEKQIISELEMLNSKRN